MSSLLYLSRQIPVECQRSINVLNLFINIIKVTRIGFRQYSKYAFENHQSNVNWSLSGAPVADFKHIQHI